MICLTVDCEQWNSPLLRGKKAEENHNTDFSRNGNENLLRLLEKHDINITFFVTGFFAEREQKHLKELARKNYEIGCHGYSHNYRNNPNLDLEQDIIEAKRILEQTTKQKISGFRAPQMQYSENLLRILSKSGFMYDSSLNPAFFPFWIDNKSHPLTPFKKFNLIEIPVAAMPGSRLPMSWVFIRLMPYSYLKYGIKKLLKEKITPVLYMHSWEFIRLKSRHVPWHFKKNTGENFLNKIDRLIMDFESENFFPLKSILGIPAGN